MTQCYYGHHSAYPDIHARLIRVSTSWTRVTTPRSWKIYQRCRSWKMKTATFTLGTRARTGYIAVASEAALTYCCDGMVCMVDRDPKQEAQGLTLITLKPFSLLPSPSRAHPVGVSEICRSTWRRTKRKRLIICSLETPTVRFQRQP